MIIKGKVSLVTGASRGIGRAVALALAKKGATVIINYRRNEKEALETKKMLDALGATSFIAKFDVSSRREVYRALKGIMQKVGHIDILVNNAGILGKEHSLMKINDEEWDSVLNTNLKGTFIVTQEVLKYMHRGKIVNIASIAGRNGGTVGVHYAASKAGLIGLTFALASQLAPDIMVNAVAPGPVDTSLLTTEKKKSLARLSPLDRIATPEEIAHAVIFLIENDYITGSVVDVNGGRYMI